MAKGNTLELFFLHSFHNNSKFHFLLLHCSALPKYTLTFIMLDLCQFDCVQKQWWQHYGELSIQLGCIACVQTIEQDDPAPPQATLNAMPANTIYLFCNALECFRHTFGPANANGYITHWRNKCLKCSQNAIAQSLKHHSNRWIHLQISLLHSENFSMRSNLSGVATVSASHWMGWPCFSFTANCTLLAYRPCCTLASVLLDEYSFTSALSCRALQ